MGIVNPSIGTTPIESNGNVVIEMLSERPSQSTLISPAQTPMKLCGYYNAFTDQVELYIVAASGIRYLRVG